MRLFVNFAPLTFGGGSERWMLDVSSAVSKVEKTALIDVDPSLSNTYGRLVLKRAYDKRLAIKLNSKKQKKLSLTFSSFIPFTREWHEVHALFSQARSIYIRYEFLESFLVLYFGGKSALNKTIPRVSRGIFTICSMDLSLAPGFFVRW